MSYVAYINPLLKNISPYILIKQYIIYHQFKQHIINNNLPYYRDILIIKNHVFDIYSASSRINNGIWTIANHENSNKMIYSINIVYPINNYFFINISLSGRSTSLQQRFQWQNALQPSFTTIRTYQHLRLNKFMQLIKYFDAWNILSLSLPQLNDQIDAFYNSKFNTTPIETFEDLSLPETETYLSSQQEHNQIFNNENLINNYSNFKDFGYLNTNDVIKNNKDLCNFFIQSIPKQLLQQKFLELQAYTNALILANKIK